MVDVDWQPTAAREALAARAKLLARLRRFFERRGVLEVETPILSAAGTTDIHIESVTAASPLRTGESCYLHTSPEFAMKRLLAAGCGDIYQVCKVFRAGEAGRMHNPEFTLVEWYRLGLDHHVLMRETIELIAELMPQKLAAPEMLCYRDAFYRQAGIDPFTASENVLAEAARAAGIDFDPQSGTGRDDWLDLIAGHLVYPALGRGRICCIYDYPASQAALARIRPGQPPVAERFEVFLEGVELANGFHELGDATEQRSRFVRDCEYRRRHARLTPPLDERLLAALEYGLPDCAGVALGFDRLVMLATGARALSEVIAFSTERA